MLFPGSPHRPLARLAAGLLVLCLAGAVTAGQAYRYRDAEGTLVYSDTLPDGVTDYEIVDMPDAPATDDVSLQERLEQMAATTERLREDRLAREEARRAREPRPNPDSPRRETERSPDYRPAYGYPYHPRVPYRHPPPHHKPDTRPPDPARDRIDDMRTPIRIPGFGENIRDLAN